MPNNFFGIISDAARWMAINSAVNIALTLSFAISFVWRSGSSSNSMVANTRIKWPTTPGAMHF